jgi:alpha-tubulin suppressor-like RCC1 family protein
MSAQYKHIQLRRDTENKLHEVNPLLMAGEPVFATDVNKLRIGDGTKRWRDLYDFVTSKHINGSSAVINLPAIPVNTSYSVAIALDYIDSNNEYAVLVSPETTLPDYIIIDHAYVSDNKEITVKFLNINSSVVDGGDLDNPFANASQATANVKLHIVTYLTYEFTTTTTTTTTPDPIVDDIYSFGYNEFGQLGLEDEDNRNTPTFVVDDTYWKTFDLGHYHGLGIDINDELYSVGYNYYGQLGLENNGVKTNRSKFNKVNRNFYGNKVYQNNPTWKKVAAGAQHSLAINSSGNLFSAGGNSYGALGLKDTSARNRFTLVGENHFFENLQRLVSTSVLNDVFTLSTDTEDRKYIADNGVYYMSGVPESSPVTLLNNGVEEYITYSGGNLEATIDGQKYYSGYLSIDVSGDYGKVSLATLNAGYMDNGKDLIYYANPNTRWTDVAAGNYHSLGIKNSSLYTWGHNVFGQLGNKDHRDVYQPTKITKTRTIDSQNLSVVINTSGNPVVFNNVPKGLINIAVEGEFRLGYGCDPFTADGSKVDSPECISRKPIKAKINSGQPFSVSSDYSFYNTEDNAELELFIDDTPTSDNSGILKVTVGLEIQFVKIAAGNYHSLALDSSGYVHSFGNNDYGQLGHGNTTHAHEPVAIEFDYSKFSDANFITLSSGSVVNIQSTLNDGDKYVLQYSPTKQYNSLERFVLSSGLYTISGIPETHPVAVLNRGKEDNITYTGDDLFGCVNVTNTTADGKYNFYYGNLYINVKGDFDKVSLYSFYQGYMGGKNILYYKEPDYIIEDISAGINHSILKTDSNQILTFGQNHKGQLGTGDTVNRLVPYRLPNGEVDKISAGGHHSLFLDNKRYIWSFGDNTFGQLGLGDNANRYVPSRINSEIKWQNVYGGGGHSIATVFSFLPNSISNLQLLNATENELVGNRQLYMSWVHQNSLEEGTIDYAIEYSIDGGTSWSIYEHKPFIDNKIILDGLDNEEDYEFRIAGVNVLGTGAFVSTDITKSPLEAIDENFDNVMLYTHMDSGNIDDLSNNQYGYTTAFLTDATRYLDGKFSEALRLYQYDGLSYNTNFVLSSGLTMEFFFKPRGSASNAPILAVKNAQNTSLLSFLYTGNPSTGYTIDVYNRTNDKILSTSNRTVDDFAHIALIRTSGAPGASSPTDFELMRLFFNGNSVASVRDETGSYDVTQVLLGSGTSFYDFDVDELRVSEISRYENNFTVTTKPFGIGAS